MNEKKRIRICYPFVGDSIGGSHLSSVELIKKLDKSKFEMILILHKKGILYEYLIKEGLKPIILKIDTFVGKKKGIAVNFLSIYKNIFKLIPFINRNNINFIVLIAPPKIFVQSIRKERSTYLILVTFHHSRFSKRISIRPRPNHRVIISRKRLTNTLTFIHWKPLRIQPIHSPRRHQFVPGCA